MSWHSVHRFVSFSREGTAASEGPTPITTHPIIMSLDEVSDSSVPTHNSHTFPPLPRKMLRFLEAICVFILFALVACLFLTRVMA